MKVIEQFFEELKLQLQGNKKLGLFYIDGIEAVNFLSEYEEELESEAPETNEFLQTSDFIDWLDGYVVYFNIDQQYAGVQERYKKALEIYKKEMEYQVNVD